MGMGAMTKLKIEANPIIGTYQSYALPLSALLANKPDVLYFVLNNFTQLTYRKGKSIPFNFYYPSFDSWTCVDIHDIIRGDYAKHWSLSVVDCVKRSIDNGGYVYSMVDEYYVPHRNTYQRSHFIHDILIYGYDEHTLCALGYDEHGHYVETTLSDKEFDDAFHAVQPGRYTVFFSYASYNQYHFEPEFNLQMIRDYVESQPTSWIVPFTAVHREAAWGMGAVLGMLEHSKQTIMEGKKLDIRFFNLYLEHKKLMDLRIRLLLEAWNRKDFVDYTHIYEDAATIKNLAIKANVMRSASAFDKIEKMLRKNLSEEREILNAVLAVGGSPNGL